MSSDRRGTPFAPHTPEETAAMLAAVGVESEEDLFDIPASVRYDGSFGIEARDERTTLREVGAMLDRNEDLVEFLGRGHYEHYVPTVVDHLSARSEFLTSYTQYQPEVAQGFLQALFEYQSLLVELTGMDVANCSVYDAATALGEAATLAARVREATGDTVLVPDYVRDATVSVLRNYTEGVGLHVERVETTAGNVDPETLAAAVDETTVLVYAANPTTYGTVEEHLETVADLAHDHDALFCLGSDPVALSLLQRPADVGADVVVGDAAALGLGTGYGMGMGLFACREAFLRQTPGRLVGASEDTEGRRAFTLTLQTREQHIRRERATSNICTNQAWVALRTAMHAFSLGPDGLLEVATDCVEGAEALAARIDDVTGFTAPVFDRHHFREFLVRTDQPAPAIAADLADEGFAVHAIEDHLLQVCTTDANSEHRDALVAAMEEVA